MLIYWKIRKRLKICALLDRDHQFLFSILSMTSYR
jgi:hypothetical protein